MLGRGSDGGTDGGTNLELQKKKKMMDRGEARRSRQMDMTKPQQGYVFNRPPLSLSLSSQPFSSRVLAATWLALYTSAIYWERREKVVPSLAREERRQRGVNDSASCIEAKCRKCVHTSCTRGFHRSAHQLLCPIQIFGCS